MLPESCDRCGSTSLHDFSEGRVCFFRCMSCWNKHEFMLNHLVGNDDCTEEDRIKWEKHDDERMQRLHAVGYMAPKQGRKHFRKVPEGIAFYGISSPDGCPEWLLSFKPSKKFEHWEIGRRFREEKRRLQNAKIPFSCPYFYLDDWEDCDSYPDGYCTRCKTDLQSNDDLCGLCKSVKENGPDISEKILDGAICVPFPFLADGVLNYRCAACMRPVPVDKKHIHHISYFPPKLCATHPRCHAVIHHTKLHLDLKPPDGDAERFYP